MKGMDDPFTAEELASATGLQGILDRVVQLSGLSNPTVRDFLHFSGRARQNVESDAVAAYELFDTQTTGKGVFLL